jgi:hypothetical protein
VFGTLQACMFALGVLVGIVGMLLLCPRAPPLQLEPEDIVVDAPSVSRCEEDVELTLALGQADTLPSTPALVSCVARPRPGLVNFSIAVAIPSLRALSLSLSSAYRARWARWNGADP